MLSDLTKYHGQGDTPRSNVLRASDPVSLKQIVRKVIGMGPNGQPVDKGEFMSPGVGNGHVIQTVFDLVDPDSNPGFDQAMDELLRQIRELYKTVLPYKQPEFNAYVKASINVYCAMLMVRGPLSTYNMVKDTVPYLHDAMTSVPSNAEEVGVVAPAKISFLEDNDISITLANYSFMVNRIEQLVIPANVKKFLDWIFANLFVDSSLQAPQYYYNVFKAIPLYGNVNGTLQVVQTWDLRTGKLEDILNSIESIITIGQMINADIHKTSVMIGMDIPDLEVHIIDKDYEYFNMLINAYGNHESDTVDYQYVDPFKEDYVRVDIIGSDDDSHLQAAAIAAARKWSQGLLIKIHSQGIYLPSTTGGVVPFYKFIVDNATATGYDDGFNPQVDPFYIRFNGSCISEVSFNRLSSASSRIVTADANNRLQLTTGYTQLGLKAKDFEYTFSISTSATREYGLIRNNNYSLFLEVAPQAASVILKLRDYVNGVDYTVDTLSASSTTCPLQYTLSVGSHGWSIVVSNTSNTLTITNAAQLAGFISLFGPTGEFFYDVFVADFTLPTVANSYTGIVTNPTLVMYYLDHIDYHVPVFTGLRIRLAEGNADKILFRAVGSVIKECYTPHIFDRAGVLAYLRMACLGLFSNGGAAVFSRQTKPFNRDRKKYKGSNKGRVKKKTDRKPDDDPTD